MVLVQPSFDDSLLADATAVFPAEVENFIARGEADLAASLRRPFGTSDAIAVEDLPEETLGPLEVAGVVGLQCLLEAIRIGRHRP